VVAALSPAVLERLGLRAALRHLGERFLKLHACEWRVRISGPCERLSRQQEEAVYRVAQESLQNCAKHSQATRVNLSLRSTDKGIRLRVADNGAGFCTDTAKNKPMAFGLAGMRERAALMGGTLAIRAAPGKGAAIVLDLPQISARV
jgi:two-component system sensor histidine kinase NreB